MNNTPSLIPPPRQQNLLPPLFPCAAVGSPESGFPASCLAARGQPIRPAKSGSGGQGSQIDRFAKGFQKHIVRFGRLPRIRISSAGSEKPAQPGQSNLNLEARAPKLIDLIRNLIGKSYASGDRSEFGFPASRQQGLWFVRPVVRKP